MIRKIVLILSIASIALCSCRKQPEAGVCGKDVVISGTIEKTKSEMSEDLATISWAKGDSIAVFDSRSSYKYVAVSASESSDFVPEGECIEDYAENLFALYPYQPSSLREDNALIATIPDVRKISASGFDSQSALAVAYASEVGKKTSMVFRNLCSFLQVYIPATDKVVRVILEAEQNEFIAGQVEVSVAHNGIPSIKVLDGSNTIEMYSEGGCSPAIISFRFFHLPFRMVLMSHLSILKETRRNIESLPRTRTALSAPLHSCVAR